MTLKKSPQISQQLNWALNNAIYKCRLFDRSKLCVSSVNILSNWFMNFFQFFVWCLQHIFINRWSPDIQLLTFSGRPDSRISRGGDGGARSGNGGDGGGRSGNGGGGGGGGSARFTGRGVATALESPILGLFVLSWVAELLTSAK